MTGRLGVLADMEFVLGVLPRDTRHVLWGPCEDIPILTGEFDELAFLFVVEGTFLLFAVVYYLIYRLTAREYFRIVKR